MKNLVFISVFMCLVCGNYSCVKDVLYVDDEVLPSFLNGILIVGQPAKIDYGKVVKTSDSLFFVFDCTSEMKLSANNIESTLIKSPDGPNCFYKSEKNIESNTTYSIAAIKGSENLSAQTITPSNIAFTSQLINVTKKYEVQKYPSGITKCYSAEMEITIAASELSKIKHLALSNSSSNIENISNNIVTKNKLDLNVFSSTIGKSLIIIDPLEIATNFKLEANFCVDSMVSNFKFDIEVINLDDEVYKYIEKYAEHLKASVDPFAVPVPAYSNIKNGLGIFGSMSLVGQTVEVDLPK